MTKLTDRLKKYGPYFFLWIIPICNFYLMEFYTHNPFTTMKLNVHIMNIVLFEAMALFLYALTGRINIALILQTLFCAIYGLAGYFVLEFRGAPIQPWDILSISTAASVADNYEYKLDRTSILVLAGFVFILLISFFQKAGFSKNKPKKDIPDLSAGEETAQSAKRKIRPWQMRLALAVFFGLILFGYTKMLHNEDIVQNKLRLYDKLFTPTTIQYKNGTLTAFLMELQYVSVEKPDHYSKEKAAELLDAYAGSETAVTDTPNIIVIMNEAFSDPAVLGEFTTNEDYMPFVHSMLDGAENTISGMLNVSVKGGNTANTEFEYLTGSTMAFLPYGSIPYQQYVKNETPTIASHLKALGYRTVAMHPYYATGWDRDTVYPNFGFEETHFLEFYKNSEKIRKYVSDKADYEKILEVYENKADGEPLFLFNVTMQNHSSYSDWNDYDNFSLDISVNGSDSKLLPAYLSLMKLSDQAIEELVNYFSMEEEKTIIVFFGDHQPTDSVVNPVLKLQGRTCSDLSAEEETLRYEVPYFIWANYDIEEETDVNTSANFLAAKTLKAAGLPLPAYFNFLDTLKEQVSVISASHVRLADGTFTYAKDQKELLNDYRALQYYLLFDH
ncbi:MAG: LTA synthase family protein [Lachnospiraceae bacterium]|nr:LTA synthase family protein [Lachnospiraceae bacterium]